MFPSKLHRWLGLCVVLLLVAGCRNADQETATPEVTIITDTTSGSQTTINVGQESAGGQTLPIQLRGTQPLPISVFVGLATGSDIPPGSTVQHTVSKGEWLLQIARCYGTSYTAVRNANPQIINPHFILPATTVLVPNVGSQSTVFSGPPCVQTYVVQAGDSWESLAATYGTTAVILQRANPGGLVVGGEIYVPSLGGTAVATPARTHSLIFNMSGNLAIWSSGNSQVEVIPDNSATIVDITTDGSGNQVLVRQTRDGGNTIEMALVNRTARTSTIVESGLMPETTSAMQETMLLSNNGAWAAYLVREGDTHRLTTFQTSNPGTLNSISGITHGISEFGLPQLFLADTDDQFYWLDGSGIYRFDYSLATGETQVHAITATIENPTGPMLYVAHGWSPNGRYLLMKGSFLEGGAYFVLDKETGAIVELPKSVGYVTVPTASWRADGSLLVIGPIDVTPVGVATGSYVPETVDGNLTLRETAVDSFTGPVDSSELAAPLIQPATIVTVIQSLNNEFTNGTWVQSGTALVQTNSFGTDARVVNWVPDGSGLLLDLPARGNVLGDLVYVSSSGGAVFSLARWLGLSISDFHWVR